LYLTVHIRNGASHGGGHAVTQQHNNQQTAGATQSHISPSQHTFGETLTTQGKFVFCVNKVHVPLIQHVLQKMQNKIKIWYLLGIC